MPTMTLNIPNRVVPRKMKLMFTKGVVNLPPHSLTIVKVPLERPKRGQALNRPD